MLKAMGRKSAEIINTERKRNGLFLYSEKGILRLLPQTDSIIRITYTENEAVEGKTGIGICYEDEFSEWTWEKKNKTIVMSLPRLVICINKDSGTISYWDKEEKLLLAERDRESRELEQFETYRVCMDDDTIKEDILTADGIKRTIKNVKKVADRKMYHTRLHLEFQKDEKLFGLGQNEEGVLNLRGTTQYIHQANLKIAVPFLLSTKGYGILLSTGSPAIFSDTQYGSYLYTEADEEMDFYFIRGNKMDDLVKGYRLLTGKASMLPRWAFGFIQSQERYDTQEEILQVAKEYRRRKIGLDMLVLDWQYWRKGEWGQKSFDVARFPAPKEMIDELHRSNIRFMISIWPVMNEETENYKEFNERKLLLPGSGLYNAFEDEAEKLYWQQVKEGLSVHGIDAWWSDSVEPITPEWSRKIKPDPAIMYTEYISETSKFIPVEVGNAYGLLHAKTIYEGQRADNEHRRVVNLARSSYSGGQRYGVILWSGDISASWECLRRQIPEGLNLCASGFPYWTFDIGAHLISRGEPWYWNGDYDNGLDDLGYRELFVRWYQLGAFLPIFRSHGSEVRREIWNFGEKGDPFYDALLQANKQRYCLIPYIYSWCWKIWKEDSTMMRMLAFEFADDDKALEITNQYMLGESMMICPVTAPMYYGRNSIVLKDIEKVRSVYLPEGTEWFDFHTDDRYSGGQTIMADAGIEYIPVFIRAGSIIPMTVPLQSTGEVENAVIEIHIYTGKDAFLLITRTVVTDMNMRKGWERCMTSDGRRVTAFSFQEDSRKKDIK